ncbi:MAG: hypothetical protein P0S95_03375 [Rhabdochlamydiaceae bacterium]|nr:hypothetical protein [Candidatus Amphrikana amoebophyrae]
MKNTTLLLLLLVNISLFAKAPVKSPEQVQTELNQAQTSFNIAKNMFNPWYTGPLITAPANNVPYKKTNIQPYIYFTDQYGQFTQNRKSVNVADIYTINPVMIYQYGLTNWLDFTAVESVFFRWRKDKYSANISDFAVTFGVPLMQQGPYKPAIRFTFGESFPLGKYKNFNSEEAQIESTGLGAFATQIGLNISKVIWWMPLHPISFRFSSNYSIPNNKANVKGFHSYGGGFGTSGKIKVGQTANLDLGLEVSITEKWVFATDLAYTCTTKSTFTGTAGTDSTGLPAENGGAFSDQLSLAPAIEYNPSPAGGFIGGVWFPLTGRNSSNFISLVLSYTYMF